MDYSEHNSTASCAMKARNELGLHLYTGKSLVVVAGCWVVYCDTHGDPELAYWVREGGGDVKGHRHRKLQRSRVSGLELGLGLVHAILSRPMHN